MKPFSRYIPWVWLILGLILLAWFFAVSGKAQEVLSISKFKGLYTLGGKIGVEPDYLVTANNVNFQRFGLNTIGMRNGYDSVCFWSGTDSILGIAALQMADGRRRLIGVRDDSAKDYGSVWATPWGSANFDSATKIQDYWGASGTPSFCTYRDQMYIVNGEQKGIVYDGAVTRSFPLQAPGEPTIVPLNAAGNLNGEYRYLLSGTLYSGDSTETIFDSYVSGPVRVKNGHVLLKDFAFVQHDTLRTFADSMCLYIYRTRANTGTLDDLDTFFLVSETAYKICSDSATKFDSAIFTDTTADANLYTSSTRTWPNITLKLGRDSTTRAFQRRYGAPTWINGDTAWGDASKGLWKGMTGQKDTLGVVYACTYVDTLTGLESDTGRSTWIYFNDSAASCFKKITVGLPKGPANVSGLMLNLYRATMIPFGSIDSTRKDSAGHIYSINKSWIHYSRIDSITILDLYRVAQIPLTDTVYADTLRSDSLRIKFPRFSQQQPPPLMSQIFTAGSRLVGIQDSRLWTSRVDSVQKWMLFDFSELSPNDGDRLTTAWLTRYGQVRAMKNFTNYNVPDDTWKPVLYGAWGCVAPFSHVSTPVGDWYASARGFILENSGPTLERTYESPIISNTLSNFTNMTLAQLSTAFSIYLPKEDLFLSSIGDTTYACFPRAGFAWSTWTGLTFGGACIYDTGQTVGLKPSESMYFFKRGGKKLYKYGSTETISAITVKTVPLFPDANLEQVDAVGLITTDCSYGVDYVYGNLYSGDSLIQYPPILFDSLYTGYRYMEFNARPATPTSLYLFTIPIVLPFTTGGIEGIEIIYRKAVERQGYR